jgi:hypothetical protein
VGLRLALAGSNNCRVAGVGARRICGWVVKTVCRVLVSVCMWVPAIHKPPEVDQNNVIACKRRSGARRWKNSTQCRRYVREHGGQSAVFVAPIQRAVRRQSSRYARETVDYGNTGGCGHAVDRRRRSPERRRCRWCRLGTWLWFASLWCHRSIRGEPHH